MLDYLPSQYLHNLRSYEYRGANHSLAYAYLLKPISVFLLNYTPEYVAPNLITLVGLFFPCMSFMAMAVANPLPRTSGTVALCTLCLQHLHIPKS